MDLNDEQQKLQKLKDEINFHNYLYHVLDAPVISDYEYDQMLKELQRLEALHPELISSDSPTQRSGSKLSEKFQKIVHPAPILSLANAFSKEDLTVWFERILKIDIRVQNSAFVMEPKIDGLTVVLHYANGIFVSGATRGDGEVGEDITSNLRTIPSIPLKIPVGKDDLHVPESFVVRGEVYIDVENFVKLNQQLEENGEKTYQNPRNTAAGSLRQLDPSITKNRPLNILVYAIVDSSEQLPDSQWETLGFLKALGFPVSEYSKVVTTFTEVLNNVDQWMELRDKIPFEIDGVVIKLDQLRIANELGVVGKDPRGAIALKYPAREVTTKLVNIGVNVGRTGVLTPFAVLQPVEVGGVIVKQATLHNFDYIREKDIRINDRILLKRAGDVIPYVIGPIVEARTGNEFEFVPPETCPSCGQKVEQIAGEVALYCVNLSCPAQLIRNVEHFVERGAMNIDGLGIKIVEQLVEAKFVKDVADLYRITKEDLLTLEGFAEKKAENLLSAINSSRNQTIENFIYALGIRGVGEVSSSDLARKFLTVDKLMAASLDQLMMVEGIGPNTAISIRDWFERSSNQELLEKFQQVGIWPKYKTEEGGNEKLQGMTFVITGTLPTLKREEAKKLIEKAGGKTTDSISRNTNFLVLGENAGSKLEKAKEFGVKMINEEELLKLVT